MKQKILIVGSSGNLGEYLFQSLKQKFKVIGISRDFKTNSLSNFKATLEVFKKLYSKSRKVDAIIVCTGKSSKISNLENDKRYLNSFESNFLTVSNTIEAYQKIFKNKPTKIIVLSSIAGIKNIDAPIEYSISKSALNYYCKLKALELSKFKININVISPGNILNKNNNWDIKNKLNKMKVKSYIKKNVPLNKFCDPSQILALCELLISDKGNFYQGANLVLDGGQSI